MKNLITITSLLAAAAMTSTAFAENITIANGETHDVSTTVTVAASEKLYFNLGGDAQSATLNIKSGSTLTVAGTAVARTTDGSSVSFGYAGAATINVENGGAFNVLNADGFGTMYSRFDLNIANGGVVNLKALKLTVNGYHNATSNVNVSGTLNLGSGGYTQQYSGSGYGNAHFNLTLKDGSTLGALENWSSTGAIASEGNVTINTTKYDATNKNYTNEGATISLSGAITSTGTITVSGVGTLDLSGANVSLANAISNSATVTVNGNTIFNLDGLTVNDNVYTLVTGGTINGEESLTYKNFLKTDTEIGGRTQARVENGNLVVTLGAIYSDLVWANDINAVWNTTAGNNVWNRTGGESGTKYDFADGDSVTFNTADATVEVAGTVDPNAVTVSENTTFTGAGTVLVDYTKLTIAGGKTLTIDGNATLDLGQVLNDNTNKTIGDNNISGSGTVKIESTLPGHGATVNLGTGFTGTLDFTGQFNWNSFTVADSATLRLSGTSSTGMWGSSDKTINNDIVFASNEYKIYTNNSNITMNGNVSAANAGTTLFLNEGSSNYTATFAGNVDFSGSNITVSASTNVVFSGGQTTIGNLNLSNGKTTFSGTSASVGTVNASGGTSTLTGTLNIGDAEATEKVNVLRSTGGTLNIENATLNLNGYRIAVRGAGTINQKSGTIINAESLRLHDEAGDQGNSTYNLSGGVLNLSSTNTGNNTSSGVLLGHWGNGKGILNVSGGVLNAKDTVAVVSWTSSGELSISGGEVNLRGINLQGQSQNSATVTLSGSGRLNIGEGGLSTGNLNTNKDNKVYNFNGGTLGALDNWLTTSALKIGGNVTIDTVKRTVSQTGASEAQTGDTAAATITLSGILSDGDAAGSLTKVGAGTLILNAANTFSGGVTINAGTVQAGNASALGTGTVKIDGGQLNVANVSLEVSALEIVLSDKYKQGAENSVAAITGTGSITDGTTITLSKSENLALTIAADSALSFSVVDSNLANSFALEDFKLGADWDGWIITSYANGVITLNNAVPEPSMFGLLAGLGALALVGARRRRKTK